jgi:hypothetical protein
MLIYRISVLRSGLFYAVEEFLQKQTTHADRPGLKGIKFPSIIPLNVPITASLFFYD